MITAKLKHLHIAPRKTRLVADLIRGKSVNQALTLLDFTPKKAARPLYKLLKSAIANAISNDEKNNKIDKDNLYISKITVDQGPTNKRWRARSRGQTFGIQKKTSHINIFLDESKKIGKVKPVSDAITEKKEEKKEKKEIVADKVDATKEKKIQKPVYKEKKEKFQPKIGKLSEKIFRRKSF